MKLLSPETLLARLHQPLHVLTSGPRDVIARQQTLRNTIEWSYQLLDAQEQQLFRRLSVFVGGCTLEAIEALCTSLSSQAESVLDTVASLADKSLLQRMDQQAVQEPRFAMLETIREYALELFKEMKRQDGTAHSLYALAKVATVQQDYAHSQALYEQVVKVARESGDKLTITPGLEGLASAVAAQGNHVWAAQLWSAAETLRETIGAPLPPVERVPYHLAVAAARTQLGEQAFAKAWAEGNSLSPEQALAAPGQVAFPTPGEGSSSPTTASPIPYPDGLTSREVEVLRVVAQGLTNEQVAERLVISPRTVDTHLTSIYSKIGVFLESSSHALRHRTPPCLISSTGFSGVRLLIRHVPALRIGRRFTEFSQCVLTHGHVYSKEKFTLMNIQKQAHQASPVGDAMKGEQT
jgi:DNA-binding CsgD family transcriptional regulator